MSFTEKLDDEGLKFFNETTAKPFSQQAVAFLNAYWDEVGDQSEFIFGCAWETIKYADMHSKGISLLHEYEEGNDLDFNIGLYFYEQLCKNVNSGGNKGQYKEFSSGKYEKSQPEMLTAIVRKKELREKIDVNFDNRISLLEYLLYQYRDVSNPSDFVSRSMKAPDEHPEVKRARLALEEVNKKIKAFEDEKTRLEENSKLPGVKGLKAKNLLAQLYASTLWEELNKALITAEAAVRRVTKQFRDKPTDLDENGNAIRNEGAVWWMNKDMYVKKQKYGPKTPKK